VGLWRVSIVISKYRQDRFIEQYVGSQREIIFKNVAVLIYVFDVTSKEIEVIPIHSLG